jgi:hypothetical protein
VGHHRVEPTKTNPPRHRAALSHAFFQRKYHQILQGNGIGKRRNAAWPRIVKSKSVRNYYRQCKVINITGRRPLGCPEGRSPLARFLSPISLSCDKEMGPPEARAGGPGPYGVNGKFCKNRTGGSRTRPYGGIGGASHIGGGQRAGRPTERRNRGTITAPYSPPPRFRKLPSWRNSVP